MKSPRLFKYPELPQTKKTNRNPETADFLRNNHKMFHVPRKNRDRLPQEKAHHPNHILQVLGSSPRYAPQKKRTTNPINEVLAYSILIMI